MKGRFHDLDLRIRLSGLLLLVSLGLGLTGCATTQIAYKGVSVTISPYR